MSIWFANAERRRAYRVVKHIRSRDVYLLVNEFGLEWEEPPAKLEENGYRQVRSKPRYAQ